MFVSVEFSSRGAPNTVPNKLLLQLTPPRVPRECFGEKEKAQGRKICMYGKRKVVFFLNWQLMCCAFQRKRESQRMCVREFARHPSLAVRWYAPVCTDTSENVVEQPAVPIKILTGPG